MRKSELFRIVNIQVLYCDISGNTSPVEHLIDLCGLAHSSSLP
jgi:hypothetical protein